MDIGALELLTLGCKALFADYRIILYLIVGTLLGLLFGVIPGLTSALAILLLLPFTYFMEPATGMGMLIAIYVGGISGSLVAAILLNIPGTPASIVTTWDGYPMAKQGRAEEAISVALFSSLFGGLVSCFALVFLAPQIASIALKFSYWEYFSLGIMGMVVVVGITAKNFTKGWIAAIIGIFIASIGFDPVSGTIIRFDFGLRSLIGGIDVLVLVVGIFVMGEILKQTEELRSGIKSEVLPVRQKIPLFPKIRFIVDNFQNLSISSMIGVGIGIIPGVGQVTAATIAWSQARALSKSPETYGKGNVGGIIASESSNNAVNGGALIPMTTLGIPGDVVTLLLLSGFIMHGLHPGPLLFRDKPELVGSIFVAYIISNFLMYFIAFYLMRIFIRLLSVHTRLLFPILLAFSLLGVYVANNVIIDIWFVIVFGVISYLLVKAQFPMLPLALGYILHPILESNFRKGMIANDYEIFSLFQYPIAIFIISISIIGLVVPFILRYLKRKKIRNEG